MREIVLDTETTGLSYRSGDRIIEVGCVELINHIATGATLQFYCSVDKKISDEAIRIHGLTNDFLSSYPRFEVNVDNFLDFIQNDDLIIHNADFDVGFINNELRMLDKGKLKNRVVDTVVMARKKLNTRIANLDYLCRRFEVDTSDRDLHGALLDSQLLAEVYLELIGGKQISMNLNNNEVEKKDAHNQITESNHNLKKIALSEVEVAKHKTLVKKIKNPLWEKIKY